MLAAGQGRRHFSNSSQQACSRAGHTHTPSLPLSLTFPFRFAPRPPLLALKCRALDEEERGVKATAQVLALEQQLLALHAAAEGQGGRQGGRGDDEGDEDDDADELLAGVDLDDKVSALRAI